MEDTIVITPEEAEAISEAFNSSTFNFLTVSALVFFALWYVLESIGLYSLAKRNEISSPWRAWIPILQISILGELIGNKVWGFGYAGPILALGQLILVLCYLFNINIWIITLLAFIYYVYLESVLNQFYKDYDPNKGILFFILGLIFPFTIPIWLFVMRKKKKGEYEYYFDPH